MPPPSFDEPVTPAAVAPPTPVVPLPPPPAPAPAPGAERIRVAPPVTTRQPEFSQKTTHVAYAPAGGAPVGPEVRKTRRSGGGWWIVPLVIIGLILLAFVVLSILPEDGDRATTTSAEGTETATATIAEGRATDTVGTIGELPPVSSLPPPVVIEEQPGVLTGTLPPNVVPTQTAPPPGQQQPPATQTLPPATQTTPPAQTTAPASSPPTREQQLSATTAVDRVRGFITSRNYYDGVADSCVQVRPAEFSNGGYTMQVWHACPGAAGSRLLGRWRVDSKTGEVFRQRDDGRFLSP